MLGKFKYVGFCILQDSSNLCYTFCHEIIFKLFVYVKNILCRIFPFIFHKIMETPPWVIILSAWTNSCSVLRIPLSSYDEWISFVKKPQRVISSPVTLSRGLLSLTILCRTICVTLMQTNILFLRCSGDNLWFFSHWPSNQDQP